MDTTMPTSLSPAMRRLRRYVIPIALLLVPIWLCFPSYVTPLRLASLTSALFCVTCTQWLTMPPRRGAFAYLCALLLALCPDVVASPAYRSVFWLADVAYLSIPGDWQPSAMFNLFAIATLAFVANVLCVGLSFYVEQHVAVHHTLAHRESVARLCPQREWDAALRASPSEPHPFQHPLEAHDHRYDDSAIAAAWLLYRALDRVPLPQLESVFCDIDLMVHLLLPSGETAATRGFLAGSNRSTEIAQHLRCLGRMVDLDSPPASHATHATILANLVSLVKLREHVADALYTHNTEFVPLLDLVHGYTDWWVDSHKDVISKHPSPFDNAFAMPCDARAWGEWSVLAAWLTLRCTVFPFDQASSTSTWMQWLFSNPASRQLRSTVLPHLHTMLEQQSSSLLNLTKRSLIPSWTPEHTTVSAGHLFPDEPILPFEHLLMLKVQELPVLPDITIEPHPDMTRIAEIQAKQAAMGVSDDQASKFNHLLSALREWGRENYGFDGGRPAHFLEQVDGFLETFSQTLPCISAMLYDNILGYRVTGRWIPDTKEMKMKMKMVTEVRQAANVKRLQRRSFVGLVESPPLQ